MNIANTGQIQLAQPFGQWVKRPTLHNTQMRLFCMDVHISVIEDFKSLAPPGVEVVDWCLSAHHWVLGKPMMTPKHIDSTTWRHLSPSMIAAFQNEYDSFLRSFDGFVVGYASCFAMVYEPYNKPIIMMNAVRYDVPFCWTRDMEMLDRFHECLHRLNTKKLLTIVSNNRADEEYTQLGCGIKPVYIPSLCLYTKTRYTPTKPTFICLNGNIPPHRLLTPKSALPTRHAWSDITAYRGIVNIFYDVSLMSMFEHFTAGCPLFFPSKAYANANPSIQSIGAYWGSHVPPYLSKFKYINNWIDLADAYQAFQSPNTYYFDSIPHLFQLLESFRYVDDRSFREAHIADVTRKWADILTNVELTDLPV